MHFTFLSVFVADKPEKEETGGFFHVIDLIKSQSNFRRRLPMSYMNYIPTLNSYENYATLHLSPQAKPIYLKQTTSEGITYK